MLRCAAPLGATRLCRRVLQTTTPHRDAHRQGSDLDFGRAATTNRVQEDVHGPFFVPSPLSLPAKGAKSAARAHGASSPPPSHIVAWCACSHAQYHCELNWIERCWAASKTYCRKNCLYTLIGLRETVPLSLSQDIDDVPDRLRDRVDLPVMPLHAQRRWARISRQYMHEYRKGKDACEAIKTVTEQRRSKRHRDCGDSRMRSVEAAMAAKAMHQHVQE